MAKTAITLLPSNSLDCVGEKNMRNVTCFVLAAALATAPAVAQNEPVADNTVDANATVMPADNMVAANDLTAAPPPETVTTETTTTEPAAAPEPRRRSSGGFPWGVVGLVGLIGLMGRKRRD
jgi:hypothetical protein